MPAKKLGLPKVGLEGNARDIFERRYALRGRDGQPKETVEEAFYRVAGHVAGAEKNPKLQEHYADLFYSLMAERRFIPNTPTWTGSKTKLGQLAACFVLPIDDDMGGESRAGIFQTLKDAALIQKSGGGNGFSFSGLRPKGDIVKSSNGSASGPVSFMEIYDAAFGNIAQGGTRRGANMAVLRVDHPDIYEFIRCKAEEGRIANFNISVGVTDAFMQAVKEGKTFDLINPRNGKVWTTVAARELFDEILKHAHHNGEPGILFLDAANRQNPVPQQYTLAATNPCGEQWLGPYENCCLGHVNLNASVRDGGVDWNHLRESVVLGVRFLDDVVTQNTYVPSVPELKEAALKNRRIGLGFLGLADVMYQLKIRYGSPESFDLASQITEFIRYHSIEASVNLAKEKEPFPGILESIYNPDNLSWEVPTPLVEPKLDWGRPKLDWSRIEPRLKKYGIRNATQMTVAPTGTTATVLGVEGYGCEPVFALAYYRNVYQSAGGEENLRLTYISPLFEEVLAKANLSAKDKKTIIRTALEKGSIQHLKNIPRQIKNTFVVSSDIKPEEHVWMQAVIQRFVDNSISKTCNFPPSATVEDVKKAYFLAWELGCKGLTVYVTGSRQEVVLETKETVEAKSGLQLNFGLGEKRPRPAVVVGRTHRIATPFGTAFITVNRNGESGHKPFEVFVTVGKSGSDTSALSEALGRLVSGWLRSSPDPDKALEEIVDQLHGIGGSTSVGFGARRVSSIPDAVAKVLLKELELSEEVGKLSDVRLLEAGGGLSVGESAASSHVFRNASVCPECHNMSLVEIEGCQKCCSCSYARC